MDRKFVEPRTESLLDRRWFVALVLALVYGSVLTLLDVDGNLLTDVGGKTATMDAMVARGDWQPVLDYWFAEHDPDGSLFPLDHTSATADGEWVNVTTLPMLLAARPLWAVGGEAAAMLLPVLGSIAAALAAGALERRFGGSGRWSPWIVGLASPAFVYALDFWEHAIGLALLGWGMVGVIDAARGRHELSGALLAGTTIGLAATLRQEALVYGFVAGVSLTVATVTTRRSVRALVAPATMAASALVVLTANAALERSLLGASSRVGRAGSVVESAGSVLGEQFAAAAAVTIFPLNGYHPLSWVLGLGWVLALVWLTIAELTDRDRRPAVVLTVLVVGATLGMWLVLGPRFVPGLVPATPLAAVGVVAAVRGRNHWALALAVAPVPLVGWFMYTDAAVLQWGGRYLLASGLVATAAAVAALESKHRSFLTAVGLASLAVTAWGVAWTVERSNRGAEAFETALAATDAAGIDLVVFRDPILAREGGTWLDDRTWLSAPYPEERTELVDALDRAGIDRFVWVDEDDGELERFDGWEAVGPAGHLGRMDLYRERLTEFRRIDG